MRTSSDAECHGAATGQQAGQQEQGADQRDPEDPAVERGAHVGDEGALG